MRILIVTMLGFNDAFMFSHHDRTVNMLTRLGHNVVAYAYLDEKNPVHCSALEERPAPVKSCGKLKIRRFPQPKYILSLRLRDALRQDGPFDIIHLHHLRNRFSYEVTRYAVKEKIPLVFEPVGLLHDPYLVRNRDFPFSGPMLGHNLIMTKKTLLRKILTRGPFLDHFRNYSQHFVLKKAEILIALSRHERDLLSELTGRNNIELVPLWSDRTIIDSVERDAFKIETGRPMIIFVGQLKYRRGFDIAIKAFSRIKKDFPGASLVIVTNNQDKKKELLNLAEREGVSGALIIKENISEEEKFSLYKQAALYLSPTRYEGFGATFLEAMACGVPVVTTDIPVVREIVEHEKTGLLARLDDPYDFYKKIKRLLTDPGLREVIIKNGFEKLEKDYDKDKIFGKLLDIYKRLAR